MALKYFVPSPAAAPEDVETIAQLLGEPVIAFRRCLVEMAESLVGGLMLAQLLFLRNHAHARARPDRRVYQTAKDWELQIAASEYEQRSARKRMLAARCGWREKRGGSEKSNAMYYWIDEHELAAKYRAVAMRRAQPDKPQIQSARAQPEKPQIQTAPDRTCKARDGQRRQPGDPCVRNQKNARFPLAETSTKTTLDRRGGGGPSKTPRNRAGRHKKTATAPAPLPLFDDPTQQPDGMSPAERKALARSAFTDLGFDKPFGQPAFQAVWIVHYVEAKGKDGWLTSAMESAIQECQHDRIGIPPQFYEAKHDIEKSERAEFGRRKP
jgi:hypothetical protein